MINPKANQQRNQGWKTMLELGLQSKTSIKFGSQVGDYNFMEQPKARSGVENKNNSTTSGL